MTKPTRYGTFHFRTGLLMMIDLIVVLLVAGVALRFHPTEMKNPELEANVYTLGIVACVFFSRELCGVYHQVWRYARTSSYMRLIAADTIAGTVLYALTRFLDRSIFRILGFRLLSIFTVTLLIAVSLRLAYQFLHESPIWDSMKADGVRKVLRKLLGIEDEELQKKHRIKIAIVGAGAVGSMLAEELINNPRASYAPVCFVDIDAAKVGRTIINIPVLGPREAIHEKLSKLGVQEVVFAIPSLEVEEKKRLYEYYKNLGYRVKVYDFPTAQQMESSGRRQMRDFNIEELLFRKEVDFIDEKTARYYRDKVVLISGGGGSIGSELCRQIAKMRPRQLIVLDIYENNAYDVQQELRIAYGGRLNLQIEIASVRDRQQLEKVFAAYRPQVVLHAAAHKHVPLMEHNCSEAVKNNVFGTLNMVDVAEKYGVEKFIMISTDKAVNPTNVMGATKRMCEMIVLSRGAHSKTSFSATRFGNVLGSNGSVIPLFKRQILDGGPITLTDKRIIRYFMTIPEASQLVLQSGAMAKSGELFVLDMGKPVKILEMAENMVRLAGFEPYKDIDIVETGLRPGEKLYEELLIKTEELDKTENEMIFIERDKPLDPLEVEQKLQTLRNALETEDDHAIMRALKAVVPTYHDPEDVNAEAIKTAEMKSVSA